MSPSPLQSAPSLHPVGALEGSLHTLHSLVAHCLATPDVRAVHRLRTQTRRVEAMMTLLALLPALPRHGKRRANLARLLRRTRRAAGKVRDLDVHRAMLAHYAAAEHATGPQDETGFLNAPKALEAADAPDTQAPSRAPAAAGSDADAVPSAAKLNRAARELQDYLGEQREALTTDLRHTLHGVQEDLVKATEALLAQLAPAAETTVAPADLLRHAESVARRSGLLTTAAARKLKEDQLHSLRKDAKTGRYLAESLPEDAVLAKAAERLEALQHLGGEWHDALEIARAARKHFGKGHPLVTAYRDRRDQALTSYQDALSALQQPSPDEKSRRSARGTRSKARVTKSDALSANGQTRGTKSRAQNLKSQTQGGADHDGSAPLVKPGVPRQRRSAVRRAAA